MKTTITVTFYKETGKWYSSYWYGSDVQCYENDKIIAEIKVKYSEARHMSFTFEAKQDDAVNRRLIII